MFFLKKLNLRSEDKAEKAELMQINKEHKKKK